MVCLAAHLVKQEAAMPTSGWEFYCNQFRRAIGHALDRTMLVAGVLGLVVAPLLFLFVGLSAAMTAIVAFVPVTCLVFLLIVGPLRESYRS